MEARGAWEPSFTTHLGPVTSWASPHQTSIVSSGGTVHLEGLGGPLGAHLAMLCDVSALDHSQLTLKQTGMVLSGLVLVLASGCRLLEPPLLPSSPPKGTGTRPNATDRSAICWPGATARAKK